MITLKTERLILRHFDISDAESMFNNWASDPEVVRFMPYDVCNSLEDTYKRITEWMRYFEKTAPNSAVFAIVLRDGGKVIGTIDFAETDREARVAEVGYQIGKTWWGRGYATEALPSECRATVRRGQSYLMYFRESFTLRREGGTMR